jgi:dCTP diphosphatase
MKKKAGSDSVQELTQAVSRFISEREWDPFHNPKNLSMGCAIEAAELMEHFQWCTGEEAVSKVRDPEYREAIEEEVADVAIYVLRFAEIGGIDLGRVILDKLVKNAAKYPVELVRGKPHKYTYYRNRKRK